MPALSVPTYLDLVVKSGLADEAALVQVFPQGAPDEFAATVNILLRKQMVTRWQHNMLCRGLWRGFFLGRYKLLKELGCGGMSSVYLAEHTLLRRCVALKVLHQKRAANRTHLTRFYRESRATAALRHPNIVQVHDLDIDGKFHYLVMEYVDGMNLQDYVDTHGPLPVAQAIEVIAQAAAGLAHAHAKGLVHRDVKPGNLLLGRHEVIKLADFGLARILRDTATSLTVDDGSVLGTVDFLAPEQAMDSHKAQPRSDVYGLGCTLYFTLTGAAPFDAGTMAVRLLNHQTRLPQRVDSIRPEVSKDLADLCEAMLAKKLEDRPSSLEVHLRLSEMVGDVHVLEEMPGVLDPMGSEVTVDPAGSGDTLAASSESASTLMSASHIIAGHVEPELDTKRTVKCPQCQALLLIDPNDGSEVGCPECESLVQVGG